MAAARPRPYRRILTSALHRRFVHASALSLLVCYIIAFLIGEKSSVLWSWLPVGPCGFRAILLFGSSLSLFILRVGQMYTGPRTTSSPFAAIKYVFPFRIGQTIAWYLFSALWFSEIYKWSCPASAQLQWVRRARIYERLTLNERPIYLHTFHILLAVVQSILHLYHEYDRIPIPIVKQTSGASCQKTHPIEPVPQKIQHALPQIIKNALKTNAVVCIATPILYTSLLRRPAWSFTMYFARLFWNFPRAATDPPGMLPQIGLGLVIRAGISGVLLLLCWQTSNLFFTTFIGREPLKRGQPLTAEAKDPNGSLLDGLKASKEVVRTFAFWELCLISQTSPDRRKVIFSDIDREGGAAWSQIMECATRVIQGITDRIKEKKTPQLTPAPPEQPQAILQKLPRITDPPREDSILASSKGTSRHERISNTLSATAKSYGRSPDWTSAARSGARDVFDRASSAILSPERKQKLLGLSGDQDLLANSSASKQNVHPIIAQILRSPLGKPLQQTYARRLAGIVLGTPHGALCPIIDAIEVLRCLLVTSLAEDQFGKVQADVPAIIRLFTGTIITLEAFIHGGLTVHWTDVTFPPASKREAVIESRRDPGVELVLNALRTSLNDLLESFGPYLREIGLSSKDVRLARESAGAEEIQSR